MESGRMIEWDDLNKKKYFLLAPSLFVGVRVLIYPFNLIKTRLFMQENKSIYNGTIDAFFKIWKHEGIRGLYKGYLFSLITLFSGQIYIVTYELLRSKFTGYRTEVKGLLAGGGATLVAQSITVPIDVITQHRMMSGQFKQWSKEAVKLPSSWDIIHRIFKQNGVRGFFRGYSISIMTFAPNSAIWWSSYGGLFQKAADNGLIHIAPLPLVQAGSGMLAAIISSVLTNPVDLIRTRYQLEQSNSIKKTVNTVWRQEGIGGLYKGLSARLSASIPVSAILVVSYEWVKRFSLKDRELFYT